MTLKSNLSADTLLKGLTAVAVTKNARKANPKFKNAEDVANYPYEVSFVVISDKSGINLGRSFKIKLRSSDNIELQQTIDFDKSEVVNGKATFWSDQNRYVQVSLKGDEIIERK